MSRIYTILCALIAVLACLSVQVAADGSDNVALERMGIHTRALLDTPAADEGADGVFEGEGEGNAPSPDEGADGVFEGNGEAEAEAAFGVPLVSGITSVFAMAVALIA